MDSRRLFTTLVLLALTGLLQACARSVADQAAVCGTSPNDWCRAPAGDPCGRHTDTASCRADLACYGMPYRGESIVACTVDKRGFSSNCPTVGCTSTPPSK